MKFATAFFGFIAPFSLILCTTETWGATLHVPTDHSTIQEAIDVASNGDEVIVAPGTYLEIIDLHGRAIRLRSSAGPDATIIDGTGKDDSVVKCVNGEDANTIIDGFAITGGKGMPFGGGMRNENSSPTISNCVFKINISARVGGGMYNFNANPKVSNCIFLENSGSDGGAIYNQNSAPCITKCEFSQNHVTNDGGAIVNDASSPTISNCIFVGNTAGSDGGAIRNLRNANPLLVNCLFNMNTANRHGGGIVNEGSNPQITNCTIAENHAKGSGGGMVEFQPTELSNPTVANSIFWMNTDHAGANIDASAQINVSSGIPVVNYSNIQGGWSGRGGIGNINIDPQFVDAANGNFRLELNSLCINKGDYTALPPDTCDLDLDGFMNELLPIDLSNNARTVASNTDMGAYEFCSQPPCEQQTPISLYKPTPDSSRSIQPIDRLAKWSEADQKWIKVSPGEITSGNIHVLVHGWARGERDCVERQQTTQALALAWECTKFFKDFSEVASAIHKWYMRHNRTEEFHVLAYSWIDDSATGATFGPINAAKSRARAPSHGDILLKSLLKAGIRQDSVKFQLIGHSHGALVATLAAIALKHTGFQVRHLTFLDSPERIGCLPPAGTVYSVAFNNLNYLFLFEGLPGELSIGTADSDTFIDNYYSTFGEAYHVRKTGDYPGQVDIDLLPLDSVLCLEHAHPVRWYATATREHENIGLAWSPLFLEETDRHFSSQYTSNLLDQYILIPSKPLFDIRQVYKVSQDLATLAVRGSVTILPVGITLFEASPASWTCMVDKGPGQVALSFHYQFLSPGDGDEFGIWLDDEPQLLTSGEVSGEDARVAVVDLSKLSLGSHFMTLALHDFGAANAQILISDFQVAYETIFTRGNANGDNSIDISDVVYVLLYLFKTGSIALCQDSLDANDDGVIDISDAIYMLQFMFLNKLSPPEPFINCGVDPVPDQLDCKSSYCENP